MTRTAQKTARKEEMGLRIEAERLVLQEALDESVPIVVEGFGAAV